MSRRLPTLAAALLLGSLCSLPASAQAMKPGLWQINNQMHSADGKLEQAMAEMQKQMAAMSPEQRTQMQDMLSKQGVNLAGLAGGAIQLKVCMTPDMIAKNQLPLQTDGECTSTRSKANGKVMAVGFTCTKPPSHGEGTVTFGDDKHYSMKMNVTTSAGGTTETLSMDASGTWLGADCGDVKPAVLPAMK